jgi:uncharacterized repeat protein (TIGR03847 family)
MARHLELNPVSHITVGTVGPPGQRVFYLQGSKGADLISVIIEKQQAAMLASSLETLLEELSEKNSQEAEHEPIWMDMRLRDPIESLFRVGNMGLGYNDEVDRIVIVAYEIVEEDEESNAVSFWTSWVQAKSLVKRAQDVVESGRPICGNCGQPIDSEGHFCPNRNGHSH